MPYIDSKGRPELRVHRDIKLGLATFRPVVKADAPPAAEEAPAAPRRRAARPARTRTTVGVEAAPATVSGRKPTVRRRPAPSAPAESVPAGALAPAASTTAPAAGVASSQAAAAAAVRRTRPRASSRPSVVPPAE